MSKSKADGVTLRFWNNLGSLPYEGNWTSESEWDDVLKTVRAGADVNTKDECEYGKTGLLYALYKEAPLSVVKVLVEEGKADVHAVDSLGSTVLHLASAYKRHQEESLAVVKYVLCLGIDPNKKNNLPIHTASFFNNIPVLRFWVEDQHVDVHVKTISGQTPLHRAVGNHSLDTVGYLTVCANANPLAKNIVRPSFLYFPSTSGCCHPVST